MRKIVSAVLVAGALVGAATGASAAPAEFGLGIFIGSTAPHPAPAPVVVERPVAHAVPHGAHLAPPAPAHDVRRSARHGRGEYARYDRSHQSELRGGHH